MKGGVGKTTVSAHAIHQVYSRYPASALLVDLDPQFNLTQTLVSRTTYDGYLKDGRTVFGAMEPPAKIGLFDIADVAGAPADLNNLKVELRKRTSGGIKYSLDLIPGDFRLVKYSVIDDRAKLDRVKARFLRFISDCRREYGLVCIDCNPSSSFMTLCALQACTHLLAPVRPDRYSILGVEMLMTFVNQLPVIHPKPDTAILINGVPSSGYDRSIENELRAHASLGGKVLAHTLRQTRFLHAGPTGTHFAGERGGPHSSRFCSELGDVAKEIATFVGLTP